MCINKTVIEPNPTKRCGSWSMEDDHHNSSTCDTTTVNCKDKQSKLNKRSHEEPKNAKKKANRIKQPTWCPSAADWSGSKLLDIKNGSTIPVL